MEGGEHMHNKFHIILMALAFVVLLNGCSLKARSSSTIQSDDLQNNLHIDNDLTNENTSTDGTSNIDEIITPTESPNKDNEVDLMQKAVKSKKTVYEGIYYDEITLYYEGTTSDSILYFYTLYLSNITETSFDFYIDKSAWNADTHEQEIILNTAYFIDDSSKAEYISKDGAITMYFEFPTEEDHFPKIIAISGYEPLEGKTFYNNSIPGHESG